MPGAIWTTSSRATGGKAPSRPSGINWSSPLAHNLAHLFWIESSLIMRDLVTGQAAPRTTLPSSPGRSIVAGVPLAFANFTDSTAFVANSASGFRTKTSLGSSGDGFAMCQWSDRTGLTDTATRFQLQIYRRGGAERYARLSQRGHTSEASRTFSFGGKLSGTSTSTALTGSTITRLLNKPGPILHSGVLVDGLWAQYADGEFLSSASATQDATINVDSVEVAGTSWIHRIGPTLIFGGRVQEAQIRELSDPHRRWDMVKVFARTYFIPAAAGGATIAAKAHHHRQMMVA